VLSWEIPLGSVIVKGWEASQLQEQTEPVREVPGRLDSLAVKFVKLVDSDADFFYRLQGCRIAEPGVYR